MVANLCYKFLGSNADYQEVVQTTFIQVFKSLEAYRGDCQLKTWIYRICANQCFKRHRQRSFFYRFFVRDEQAMSEIEDDSVSSNPEENVMAQETRIMMNNALQTLEAKKRLVLVLHDMEGCSLQEISEITDVSIGTVKSRLFYARRDISPKLRKLQNA